MKNGKTYKEKRCNPEQLLLLFSVPQALDPLDCEPLEGISPIDVILLDSCPQQGRCKGGAWDHLSDRAHTLAHGVG